MRRIIIVAVAAVIAVSTFLVSPFYSAWAIREAVINGNSAYLDAKVEWVPVKVTLKESMRDFAMSKLRATPIAAGKLSLWQDLKARFGRSMVDKMVDRYANASGLPTLFSYGQNYRHYIRGMSDPTAKMNIFQRMAYAWQRVRHAKFTSPTRFEMILADKYEPDKRQYFGVLELRGLTWKMTGLCVQKAGEKAPMLMAANI